MARLRIGDKVVRLGDQEVLWGDEFEPLAPGTAVLRHLTIHIKPLGRPDGEVWIWTGRGDLSHDGATYKSYPVFLLGVDSISHTMELDDSNRMRVNMFFPEEIGRANDILRRLQGTQPSTDVTVRLVFSEDSGASWDWFPNSMVTGKMSGLTLSSRTDQGRAGKQVTFTIATPDADVDRGYTSYWDDKTQRRKYPGRNDKFFEHVQKIEQGVYTFNFPKYADDPTALR